MNIIQHGIDGIGHQLHGLLSCLALHNINNYYFDGYVFINKNFRFDHITDKDIIKDMTDYIIEIGKCFIEKYKINKKIYKKHQHSHELHNIPKNYDNETIYSLDNCYYFNKIPIDKNQYKQYLKNIQENKNFFTNNKLPKNRLNENNVVIHLRQGDAITTGRGKVIHEYNEQIVNIMPMLLNKYKNYKFYIHTDGNADFITNLLKRENVEYIVYKKDEHILNVISDFIYSKVFIIGNSALSIVCTFLGNHDLIIVPDNIKHSLPENITRISNYKND